MATMPAYSLIQARTLQDLDIWSLETKPYVPIAFHS